MANNRLFIVDTETGERFLLCKSMGDGWYVHHDCKVIDEWLDHRDIGAAYSSDQPTKLKLVTENSDTDASANT